MLYPAYRNFGNEQNETMNNKYKNLLRLISAGIQAGIALLLSLVITVVNNGFSDRFLNEWAKGFIVALIIIPPALRLIPYVMRAIQSLLGNRSLFVVRCAVSICFATMMEGIISLAVTLVQFGLSPGWLAMWGLAFVKALPVGLIIGFTMTFVIHPQMVRLAIAGQK